jgi:hypothetical protein
MGSSTQETNSNTHGTTGPWARTQPALEDLINRIRQQMVNSSVSPDERQAVHGLERNIKYTNEYLPQHRSLLNDLFKGGGFGQGMDALKSSWDTANTALTPIARGDFLNMESNPYIQAMVNKTQGDVYNRVGGMFAGSGRTASGAHMNALGSGIGDATNNLYYNAYSGERDRQSGAIRDLISGSVGYSGAMDQAAGNVLGARTQGSQFAPIVTGMRDDPFLKQLELSQMRRSMPLQNLGMLRDLLVPIAGLGSQNRSMTNTTTEMTPNPMQMIMGGAMGGLNALSGGFGGFGGGSMFGSRGASPGGGNLFSLLFGG